MKQITFSFPSVNLTAFDYTHETKTIYFNKFNTVVHKLNKKKMSSSNNRRALDSYGEAISNLSLCDLLPNFCNRKTPAIFSHHHPQNLDSSVGLIKAKLHITPLQSDLWWPTFFFFNSTICMHWDEKNEKDHHVISII